MKKICKECKVKKDIECFEKYKRWPKGFSTSTVCSECKCIDINYDNLMLLTRKDIEINLVLYRKILIFLKKNNINLNWEHSYKQVLYHYTKNIKAIPLCHCGKENPFKSAIVGYRKTCSVECAYTDERFNKIKETKLERYGDENYNNREKMRATNLEKYGDENYNNREQAEKTNIEIYGYHSPMMNKDVQDKAKAVKLEKYGDENYNNREQATQTLIDRYGTASYTNYEKQKATLFEKYGDETYNNIELNKATKLERYGDENYNNPVQISETLMEQKQLIHDYITFLNITGSHYIMWCHTCGNIIEMAKCSYYERMRAGEVICNICNNISHKHLMENEIADYIKTIYNKEIIRNNRKILDGLEIDILLNDIGLGVEFNGIYWHSILEKEELYHYNKKQKALSKNIDLIFIWEDDWCNKKEETKQLIYDIIYDKFIYNNDADLYLRKYGEIKIWETPINIKRTIFDTYNSGKIFV